MVMNLKVKCYTMQIKMEFNTRKNTKEPANSLFDIFDEQEQAMQIV